VPSNPEEEFWTREDRRGRGGQGGGWAYWGLVRAEGCGEGVGGWWGEGGVRGGGGRVGGGSERSVLVKLARLPLWSTMDCQWEELVGERRPGESNYWGRGSFGQPGPDCGGSEVRMGRGSGVQLSCNPNNRQSFGLAASTKSSTRQAAARSGVRESTTGQEEGVNSTINLEREEGMEEPMAFVSSQCCCS